MLNSLKRSFIIIVVAFSFVFLVVFAYEIIIAKSEFIWFGVKIDGVSIGGLPRDKAGEKIQKSFKNTYNTPVNIEIENKNYPLSFWQLGYRLNSQAPIIAGYYLGKTGNILNRWQERQGDKSLISYKYFNKSEFIKNLSPLNNLYYNEGINSHYNFDTEEKSPSIKGYYLDIFSLYNRLNIHKNSYRLEMKEIYPYPSEKNYTTLNFGNIKYKNTYKYQKASEYIINLVKETQGEIIYPYEEFSLKNTEGFHLFYSIIKDFKEFIYIEEKNLWLYKGKSPIGLKVKAKNGILTLEIRGK